MRVTYLTLGCWGLLRLGVSNCYVWWLVSLRLWDRDSYVLGLVFLGLRVSFLTFGSQGFLRLGASDSYVWGLVFLRFGVRVSYVWGLDF